MALIDLSMPLSASTTPVPGHPCPEFEPYHELERDGIRNTLIRMTLHTATHVDAPSHIVSAGITIDEVDPGRLSRAGIRLDLRRFASAKTPFTLADLEAAGLEPESVTGRIIVLNSGWTDAHVNTPMLYGHNPFLSLEATEALVAAKPSAIALDFAIDEAMPWPNHKLALGAGIPLIENLMGLERLPREGFVLSALPMKVVGGDGAPARAVAVIEA